MDDLTPTPEQAAVVASDVRVMRINARAGTGKTTTLDMIARAHPDRKMLYLVFNRRAREAADAVFPKNVKAYTLHGLAFAHEGRKWREKIGHFSPADLLAYFNPDEQALAGLCHGFLAFFLNSAHSRLEGAVTPFTRYLNAAAADRFNAAEKRIIDAARKLATAWNRKQVSCPHDFYLKLFHKSGAFFKALNQYDTVLVDEGQDLSPIMLDALEKCRKRIVVVGDTHQQIYSFRYAIDAMRQLSSDMDFELTRSFRFGNAIAKLSALFIQEAKHRPDFRIKGNSGKKSRVGIYHRFEKKLPNDTAILSRTNLSLFANAMALRARGLPFRFERDIQPVLWQALDVFRLKEGDRDRIKDRFVASFSDADGLKNYAEQTDDWQLQGICNIVSRYANAFPEVVFEMAGLCKAPAAEQKGTVLSTIHSAKGRQYDRVYIDEDVAAAFEPDVFPHISEDEINLAYVGFTRAVKNLYLPMDFLSQLTTRWQTHLDQCRTDAGPGTSHKRQTPSFQGKKAGKTSVKTRITIRKKTDALLKKSTTLMYQAGDRVNTSLGPGTILKVQGSQCLVDLDRMEANVWQRMSEILPPPSRSG